jgi:hypothetical protein
METTFVTFVHFVVQNLYTLLSTFLAQQGLYDFNQMFLIKAAFD